MSCAGPERRLRILTWHIHGSYFCSLVQRPHEFYLPVREGRPGLDIWASARRQVPLDPVMQK